MSRRTSPIKPAAQPITPFDLSYPHPVKFSGPFELLEPHFPNAEILPSCTDGILGYITSNFVLDLIQYGA